MYELPVVEDKGARHVRTPRLGSDGVCFLEIAAKIRDGNEPINANPRATTIKPGRHFPHHLPWPLWFPLRPERLLV